jgi:AsmA protein
MQACRNSSIRKGGSLSKLIKISLLLFGVTALSAIVMMVLVKTMVTPEKVREILVPLAEKSLHRKVTLGKIKIGLFSGISIEDLHIRQKVEGDDAIIIKAIDLRYRFLPLFRGMVAIDQIKVVQPRITVIKYPDGTLNFSDLLDRKVITEEKSLSGISTAGNSTASGSTINLLINEVAISGGEVLFVDGSKDGKAPARYMLNQLSFQARLMTFDTSFPIELSATLNGNGIALSAQLTGQIMLAGKTSEGESQLKNARVHLKDIQTDIAGMKAGLSGDIEYDGRRLQAEKLNLNLGDQQALLTFMVTNLSGNPITGDFRLSADIIDINKLIPETTPEAVKPGKTGTPESGGKTDKQPMVQPQQIVEDEVGPFNLPLEMQGEITVNKVIYRQLALEQLDAGLQMKNNLLHITRLHGRVAGGELTAVTDVDLGVKGLNYQGQLDMTQVQPASLINGLFPNAQKSITGSMQSKNTFSGYGTHPDNMLKNLLVKGQAQVQKGQVTGSLLLKQVAGLLANPELEVLTFEILQSQYELRDRVVHLTGNLDSSKIRLQSVGTVSLDGPLDLNLNAHLAPGIFASSSGGGILQQVITNEDGWGMLPLKVDGTISNPRCSIDNKALQKQAVGKALKEVQRLLQKKVAPEGGDAAPAKQLLDKTFNKLFGN